jgi:hypothetical protein
MLLNAEDCEVPPVQPTAREFPVAKHPTDPLGKGGFTVYGPNVPKLAETI